MAPKLGYLLPTREQIMAGAPETGPLLALAERLASRPDGAAFAEAWNFGPAEADAIPVGELVGIAARLWGEGAGWTLDKAAQPHEAHDLKVDASKARARLGWRPVLGIEEALGWTVDWYQRQARGESARTLCLDQIARYEARLVLPHRMGAT